MKSKFLITALAFSVGLMTQAVFAMDMSNEEWGADVKGPIRVSMHEGILHMNCLEPIEPEGKSFAPIILIQTLPEDKGIEQALRKCQIKADTLIVNGKPITTFPSFSPMKADPSCLRLRVNNIDVSLIKQAQKTKDFSRADLEKDPMGTFREILSLLTEQFQQSEMEKVDDCTQWKIKAPINIQGYPFSQVKLVTSKFVEEPGVLWGTNLKWRSFYPTTLKLFQDCFRDFTKSFEYFSHSKTYFAASFSLTFSSSNGFFHEGSVRQVPRTSICMTQDDCSKLGIQNAQGLRNALLPFYNIKDSLKEKNIFVIQDLFYNQQGRYGFRVQVGTVKDWYKISEDDYFCPYSLELCTDPLSPSAS
jgi:hypothetical protein